MSLAFAQTKDNGQLISTKRDTIMAQITVWKTPKCYLPGPPTLCSSLPCRHKLGAQRPRTSPASSKSLPLWWCLWLYSPSTIMWIQLRGLIISREGQVASCAWLQNVLDDHPLRTWRSVWTGTQPCMPTLNAQVFRMVLRAPLPSLLPNGWNNSLCHVVLWSVHSSTLARLSLLRSLSNPTVGCLAKSSAWSQQMPA